MNRDNFFVAALAITLSLSVYTPVVAVHNYKKIQRLIDGFNEAGYETNSTYSYQPDDNSSTDRIYVYRPTTNEQYTEYISREYDAFKRLENTSDGYIDNDASLLGYFINPFWKPLYIALKPDKSAEDTAIKSGASISVR